MTPEFLAAAAEAINAAADGLREDNDRAERILTSFHSTPQLWVAYRASYCGCGECKHPMGFGRSEQNAIADLKEQEAA